MASCLMHPLEDESITLSGVVSRRLLERGDGDAALLYLCLLRRRGRVSAQQAGEELRWERHRTEQAETTLRDIGLLSPAAAAAAAEEAEPTPPEYRREDVAESLERNSEFRLLTGEVERKLGKRLTTPDVSVLLGLYDYLGLPIDVIFLLVGHCLERIARQYGPGRKPTLRQIEKEGYGWARRGLDTQERAAAYLKQYSSRQGRLPQYMRALQLGDRLPAPTEEKYLLEWLEMEFPPETVALAYDKTVTRCHELKWGYLNGILKNWHGKNLHSLQEIEAGDNARKKGSVAPTAAAPNMPDRERAAVEELRRLMREQ